MRRKFIFLTLLFSSSYLGSLEPPTYLTVAAGPRHDQFSSLVVVENPKGSDPTQNTKLNANMNMWLWGVRGAYSFGNLCFDEVLYFNQFYIKGDMYWGHVYRSHDKESVSPAIGQPPSQVTRANISDAKPRQYYLGVGWLYPACEWISLGPSVGYEWNISHYERTNVKRNCVAQANLDKTAYSSRWRGPWLGFNTALEVWEWRLDAGYEYHWNHWQGAFKTPHPATNCTLFNDRREIDGGSGHAAYLDLSCVVADCFKLNLEGKFVRRESTTGKRVPVRASFLSVGCPLTRFDRMKYARLNSWQLTFDVGYGY